MATNALRTTLFHKFGDKLAHFFVGLPGDTRLDDCGNFVLRKAHEAARKPDAAGHRHRRHHDRPGALVAGVDQRLGPACP